MMLKMVHGGISFTIGGHNVNISPGRPIRKKMYSY